jgi:hypothetical protein
MSTLKPTNTTTSSESSNAIDRKSKLTELEDRAYARAVNGTSVSNFEAIIEGFTEKGIAAQDIRPRINVFTFHAWCKAGRCVKKGEHGVKICTYVAMDRVNPVTGAMEQINAPRRTTVFHLSQTEPLRNEKVAA